MAAAGPSHPSISRGCKQGTSKVARIDDWDAAKDACTFCSACLSLLIRPTCDASTQNGVGLSGTNSQLDVRRSLFEVSSAAMEGCITCNMILAARNTLSQHIKQVDRLDGFKLALYWFDDIKEFERIEVLPVDYMYRDLSHHGHRKAIRLVPAGDLVRKSCSKR